MTIFAAIVITLVALLGVVLTVVNLPGIWVMIAVALVTEMYAPEVFGWPLLIAALVLAILAEIAEFFASAAGTSKAGGTRSGMVGSIIGGIMGMIGGQVLIPIPIVGAIIGGIAGAWGGAVIAERGHAGRSWKESITAGHGAAVGRALSTVVKGGFAVVVAIVLVSGAWIP
ncbi:MAG: DUF456 domain-containing protein [Planctomycetota bacterium]